MSRNNDVFPDDVTYPYGRSCPHCQAINSFVDLVCSKCGSDYNVVQCKVCGTWYAKVWDQRGDGCPMCLENKGRK